MSETDSPEKTPSPAVDPLPRENPFKAMAQMVRASTGRLPGHLVVIFVFSLAVTALCGILFKLSESRVAQNSGLVLRVKPEEEKPALSQTALRGIWLAQNGDALLTLKIGSNIFEILYRVNSESITRYYIRGSYRTEGNVIVLQQRKEMGTPFDPNDYRLEFYPLEVENINIYADLAGSSMSWRIPPREAARLTSSDIVTRDALRPMINWIKVSATP